MGFNRFYLVGLLAGFVAFGASMGSVMAREGFKAQCQGANSRVQSCTVEAQGDALVIHFRTPRPEVHIPAHSILSFSEGQMGSYSPQGQIVIPVSTGTHDVALAVPVDSPGKSYLRLAYQAEDRTRLGLVLYLEEAALLGVKTQLEALTGLAVQKD